MTKNWSVGNYEGIITLMDKPYVNRPRRIDYPQLALFRETIPSRDYFISGRPEYPDEGREYIPWTKALGAVAVVPEVDPPDIAA